MAGAGFKTFNTGDVLTASDVNTYLMQQTVMVFADSSARSTALGANVAEGMLSYLEDTDAVEKYNGSSWVAVGGAGLTSPLTTKGDVWGYSTTDARIPVGANGTVLTADSAEALGVKWATPSAGGMTLIATASPTGVSTYTFSSIPSTHKHLLLTFQNVKIAVPNILDFRIRVNGVTSSDYGYVYILNSGNTLSGGTANVGTNTIAIGARSDATNAWKNLHGEFYIYDYTGSGTKTVTGTASGYNGSQFQNVTFRGLYDSGATISSITLFDVSSNNYTGGTFNLYGVS